MLATAALDEVLTADSAEKAACVPSALQAGPVTGRALLEAFTSSSAAIMPASRVFMASVMSPCKRANNS